MIHHFFFCCCAPRRGRPEARLAHGKVNGHRLIPVIEPACGAAREAAFDRALSESTMAQVSPMKA